MQSITQKRNVKHQVPGATQSTPSVPAPKLPIEKVKIGPRERSKPQAEIVVHRDGDRIESFVITCPCGEKITVQCNYQ